MGKRFGSSAWLRCVLVCAGGPWGARWAAHGRFRGSCPWGSRVPALVGTGHALQLQGCPHVTSARSPAASGSISLAVLERAAGCPEVRVRVRVLHCISSAGLLPGTRPTAQGPLPRPTCAPVASLNWLQPPAQELASQLKCLHLGLSGSGDLGRCLGGRWGRTSAAPGVCGLRGVPQPHTLRQWGP